MRHISTKQIREEVAADVEQFGRRSARLPLSDSMRTLLFFTYGAVQQFPKYEKHSGLAAEIRSSTWLLQELILTARRYQRLPPTDSRMRAQIDRLERIRIRHEVLKMQVRTAADRKYISLEMYGQWARHLVEIGRQIGGWLASLYEAKGAAL